MNVHPLSCCPKHCPHPHHDANRDPFDCARLFDCPSVAQPRAPFVIGTDEWPGLAKLAEECGELLQVIGKIIAFPDGDHPDGGPPLHERLQDELADVSAAVEFVVQNNDCISWTAWIRRHAVKLQRFMSWHNGGS